MQSILIIKEIRDVICKENKVGSEGGKRGDSGCLHDEEEELRNLSWERDAV